MGHLLWIIGRNHAVALDEIRSIEPGSDGGGVIVWKGGDDENIDAQELDYLMKGLLQTQGVNFRGNNGHARR